MKEALQQPLEVDGLDDETQCRTDSIDIFIHDSLNDSCLASIVEAANAKVS